MVRVWHYILFGMGESHPAQGYPELCVQGFFLLELGSCAGGQMDKTYNALFGIESKPHACKARDQPVEFSFSSPFAFSPKCHGNGTHHHLACVKL